MQLNSSRLAYSKTNYFSSIVSDYISGEERLLPFYSHTASIHGIKAAIADRESFGTNHRQLLVQALKEQYRETGLSDKQQCNLEQLAIENTFTVCTAHQPNIFTGHLYFIYKILHAVKLADSLAVQIPGNNFVPVYYMGSEDADLEELGHIYLNGEKYEWKTDQTGAVGRMKVDKALVQMIDIVSGQLLVQEFGKQMVGLMKACYQLGVTIEQATFKLVNELFAAYGLLILLPDSNLLKKAFIPVIKKELLEGFSHKAVQETMNAFPSQYKVQASGREVNLFYLTDGSRDRIEKIDGKWAIVSKDKNFSTEEILQELDEHPERFSPNVILRPVFQEMILPNIAFIGGGGEIAYWLELKKVFAAVAIPFPVLLVRNSFLLIEEKYAAIIKKLQFSVEEIFKPEFELMNRLVKRDTAVQLSLEEEKEKLKELYEKLKDISGKVDMTLQKHTAALSIKALQKLEGLEKKMLRAEKRKFEAQRHQLQLLKNQLFPNNSLQERVENFMLYYARRGNGFIQTIYDNSLTLEQEFVILGL